MNRRQLLAMGALALTGPLAGCLGGSEPITPSGTVSAPSEDCGPASQPLSARLGDNPGDPGPCFEGATPSLIVENEREDEVTVDIDGAGFTGAESLDAGERVVARSAFEAVEGGETESYEFDDGCWGVFAGVMDDGTLRLGEIGID